METYSQVRDPRVREYLERCELPSRQLILELRQIVIEAEPKMEEAIKWNRITFTLNGNWHHWICGIEQTKKYVSLIFHKGALLADTSSMLQGTGQYTRQLKITPHTEINREALAGLIKQAAAVQTVMR